VALLFYWFNEFGNAPVTLPNESSIGAEPVPYLYFDWASQSWVSLSEIAPFTVEANASNPRFRNDLRN